MNTEYRKNAKNDLKKTSGNGNGMAMENVRKHRDIKLVTTDNRRNRLVSEPNNHTTKWCSENLLAIEMKKTKVKMNKPIYLGLSILEMIGLMKDELEGKIMTEFVALRPKTYSYLTDDCEEDKRAKGSKKCVIKRRLNLMIIKTVC